jgi:integrase
LPDYALDILNKYSNKAKPFLLPRLSATNLNIGIKSLIKLAGWDYSLPKMRQRQGEAIEIKNKMGKTYKFYEHITAHTMRRTAITTLLLMGVDENTVRRISGHAAGSKEFYKYVIVVQDYLNSSVRAAYLKLINEDDITVQKLA